MYPEIDIVATPSGKAVAMVHCNNCTNDMNAWVGVLKETAALFGAEVSTGELFTRLYQKSLEGDPDCGGVLVYNYLAGEGVTHFDEGRPMVVRRPDSRFTLGEPFARAALFHHGNPENRHGPACGRKGRHPQFDRPRRLFKTPGVGQRYMAAACGAPVTCMETAGEGGPYGMALLAAYRAAARAG